MRKYKLKEIRDYIRSGMAEDITTRAEEITEPVEKIGYSTGVYGLNGGLLQGMNTGKYYAVTARSSNLFRYF